MCVKVIPSLLRKNSVFGKEVVVFQVLITFSKDLYTAIHDKLHVTCISEFQVVRYYYTKTFVSLNPQFSNFMKNINATLSHSTLQVKYVVIHPGLNLPGVKFTMRKDFFTAIHDRLHVTCISEF